MRAVLSSILYLLCPLPICIVNLSYLKKEDIHNSEISCFLNWSHVELYFNFHSLYITHPTPLSLPDLQLGRGFFVLVCFLIWWMNQKFKTRMVRLSKGSCLHRVVAGLFLDMDLLSHSLDNAPDSVHCAPGVH